ncbi:MAG TPA: right-handed parallel beta-helix repeat-containing protein [Pyrinomonadaceae bacterium]|jgi:hypothetical protein|nr:right-handed parallel beta-helix repeat-containing protein [Pyrinomonadaceae bacterium]
MNQTRLIIRTLGSIVFILALTSLAQAQATRTWVSGVGDDVNPCSRTAPCKTYAGAISKTAKDGEISTLDPGGFGTVTITKSLYINGTHGQGYGSILAALTTGVTVNITDAADVRKTVRLRSLDINGASTGTNGVSYIAGNNVFIEDCVIDGFTGNGSTTGIGIRMALGTSGDLFVKDTVVRNVVTGMRVTTTSGFAVATVTNTKFENNTTGVEVTTNGFATIRDSVASQNTGDGIKASGNGVINVTDSTMAHNAGTAINASASGSTIRVASSRIFANGVGIAFAVGGTVSSDGQNRLTANGSTNAPNGPAITIQ